MTFLLFVSKKIKKEPFCFLVQVSKEVLLQIWYNVGSHCLITDKHKKYKEHLKKQSMSYLLSAFFLLFIYLLYLHIVKFYDDAFSAFRFILRL